MLYSLALISLSLASAALARPKSYAVWAADSAIARSQGNGLDANGKALVSYEHGEFQWGLRQLFELTGNRTYYDYVVKGVDNIVFDNGTVHGSYTYQETQKAKYKIAADIFRNQLNAHPRTSQGQFWHKLKYPNQGWLDGVYMAEIFYAQYTNIFEPGNTTAWADITSQFQLMYENTVQNATAPNNTGLMYHGYDYSHKQAWASADRGHSPEVWDRAMGWYTMALVDVLEIIPSTNPGHSTILNILQTLAPRIRDAADPVTGAWWLVVTQPGRTKNYFESSGTAMFVYALLRAVRLGYLPDADGTIVTAAKKAYQYITANWVVASADGTMNWLNTVIVGSLDTTGDFNYYVSQAVNLNDLKGLAAFVLASLEYERLVN
ncbi:hypothetical protein H0H81_004606 [Sphagnurus paluster]|uniref:Glycoside hydrolase family 105 protein n=1 Tax=Sphagnurus paluster TaxID=117069 RepID=A0A9P7KLB9_9AGAR|nr:hypothetical protein H0H81_004606 [Sphagnurus paluster]